MLEIVSDFNTDTWRTVYAVGLGDAVCVLHAFQKKSKDGITTPQKEIDLIKSRLKLATEEHEREIKVAKKKR